MIVFWGLFSLLISVVIISSQKECFQINSGGYERFCSDNYVRKNGECIECTPGTKSKNEEPCTPCNIGTFGRKCFFSCNCSNRQRCDIVDGCVDIYLVSTERGTYKNATSDGYAATNEINFQTDAYQTIVETKEGLSEREIYIYSAGFGGLFILILSSLPIFIYVSRQRTKQLRINQILEQNDNSVNGECLDESVYDSIDETAMCDDNFPKRTPLEINEQDNILPSSSEESSKSSGYLHPYTTLTENNASHLYRKPMQSNSSSASSSPGNVKRDSGYTHPYQQLKQELQTTPKSEYTELTVVHYLELVDVTIKAESHSRNALMNYTEIKQRSREIESHKYSDCSSSLLCFVRNSSPVKFYSEQHLHLPNKLNGQDMSNNSMCKAVKYNSI